MAAADWAAATRGAAVVVEAAEAVVGSEEADWVVAVG
jgi:hypothetical protein